VRVFEENIGNACYLEEIKNEIEFIQAVNMFFKKNYIIPRGLSGKAGTMILKVLARCNQAYLIRYIQKLFLRDVFRHLLY
jgi:hypothetical protein